MPANLTGLALLATGDAERARDMALGMEMGLVVLVFGHAILTHTFIGVLALFVASQVVFPRYAAEEAGG